MTARKFRSLKSCAEDIGGSVTVSVRSGADQDPKVVNKF
jgi:hypothetical protein